MSEQTFFCIRPQFFTERESIKNAIKDNSLSIVQTKVVWLTESDVRILYANDEPSPYFDASVKYMTDGFSEVGIIEKEDAIAKLSQLTGDGHIPKNCAPGTLRRMFGRTTPICHNGHDYYLNPIHRPRDISEAEKNLNLFRQLADRSLSTTICDMMRKLHQNKNLLCVFDHHIMRVVAFGQNLCSRFGGNREVVKLASLLHDIASLNSGKKHEHHIKGAQEAGHVLDLFGQQGSLITRVQECIQSHRGSVAVPHTSKEAEIVCAADGLANLSYPPLLFFFAFQIRDFEFAEGMKSIRRKVESSFKKIPEFAKPDALPHLDSWNKILE